MDTRRTRRSIVAWLLVAGLARAHFASAAVLEVAPSGAAFSRVQDALDAAVPGDVVRLRAGVWHEKVNFPRSGSPGAPIVLEAAPGETAVLDGTGVAGQDMVRIENRSHVAVRGLEIRNDTGVTDGSGIRVLGSGAGIEIRGNHVHDVRGRNAMGITVYATGASPISGLVVAGNHVHDCEPAPSEAIVLNGNVDGFEVSDNVVTDVNNIGIDAIGGETDVQPDPAAVARNGTIRGNVVRRARSVYGGGFAAGIYVDGGRDLVVERNEVAESDLGIEIGAENAGIVTRNVAVRDNLLHDNDKAGLVFGGYASGTGRVADCTFTHNTLWHDDALGQGYGEVWVQWGSANTIAHNVIVARPGGVLLSNEEGDLGNALDWNLWHADGSPSWVWHGDALGSLAAFRSASGQATHDLFADPLLAAPASGDFHLAPGSPAIDSGTPGFTPAAGELDLDGGARVIGPRVDRGADEAARCGDATVQPPESCDDGNATSGDGCDANCTATACGNGVVTAGESCDDGNLSAGDCCDAACALEPAGSGCDDGDACTTRDACDGAGACSGATAPSDACLGPGSASISIRGGARPGIVWKWQKGPALDAGVFGDPLAAGAGFVLCVHDPGGAQPLALRAGIPAGGTCRGKPCWKRPNASSLRFASGDGAPDGVTALVAKAGATGKSQVQVTAKGALFAAPALPLNQSQPVVVQLHAPGGACFGSAHPAPARRTDEGRFDDDTR